MVEPPRVDAAPGKGGCLVLQRRPVLVAGDVALGLVVDRERVPVRVAEHVRRTGADLAVDPALAEPDRLDRRHAPLERVLRRGPHRRAAHARGIRCRQLDRVELVLVPRAQEDRVAAAPRRPASRAGRGRTTGSSRTPGSAARRCPGGRRRTTCGRSWRSSLTCDGSAAGAAGRRSRRRACGRCGSRSTCRATTPVGVLRDGHAGGERAGRDARSRSARRRAAGRGRSRRRPGCGCPRRRMPPSARRSRCARGAG